MSALRCHKRKALAILAGLTATLMLASGADARKEIQGLVEGSVTWTSRHAPYVLIGETVVAAEATLHIAPTVKLVFRPGSRLRVQGRLEVLGATIDGGRAIDNREVIHFEPSSSGFIRHSILEDVELQIATPRVAVTHNYIANRNGNGITVDKRAVPFIAQNDFAHNSYFALYKEGTDPLRAPDNYWGAPDGPSGAGPGRGDAVNARIDFKPFAAVAVGQYGLTTQERLKTPAAAPPRNKNRKP